MEASVKQKALVCNNIFRISKRPDTKGTIFTHTEFLTKHLKIILELHCDLNNKTSLKYNLKSDPKYLTGTFKTKYITVCSKGFNLYLFTGRNNYMY